MESPLEVLSRAATMVQDKSAESKLPNKELPTTKWRRERRRLSEYHQTSGTPLNSNNAHPYFNHIVFTNNNRDSPLDMSITTSIKSRSPPPYREPLPGSTFAMTIARPSVITVGPKVKVLNVDVLLPATSVPASDSVRISSQITATTQTESAEKGSSAGRGDTTNKKEERLKTESISMCDTVIDEHFRRSLGNNYMELFDSNKKQSGVGAVKTKKAEASQVGMSVDDHFAKALGETWNKIKAGGSDQSTSEGTRGSSEEEEEDEEDYEQNEYDEDTSDDRNLGTNNHRNRRVKRQKIVRRVN